MKKLTIYLLLVLSCNAAPLYLSNRAEGADLTVRLKSQLSAAVHVHYVVPPKTSVQLDVPPALYQLEYWADNGEAQNWHGSSSYGSLLRVTENQPLSVRMMRLAPTTFAFDVFGSVSEVVPESPLLDPMHWDAFFNAFWFVVTMFGVILLYLTVRKIRTSGGPSE